MKSRAQTEYEKLTQAYLNALFEYNPETGELKHKTNRGKVQFGDIAGTERPDGYIQITINYQRYLAHRLIWLMQTGEHIAEDMEIDHINRKRSFNKWTNLRLATRLQNSANCPMPITNTSGIKGVSWVKHAKKWRATIQINNKCINLGYFDTTEAAAEAYENAALKFFGKFANFEIIK